MTKTDRITRILRSLEILLCIVLTISFAYLVSSVCGNIIGWIIIPITLYALSFATYLSHQNEFEKSLKKLQVPTVDDIITDPSNPEITLLCFLLKFTFERVCAKADIDPDSIKVYIWDLNFLNAFGNGRVITVTKPLLIHNCDEFQLQAMFAHELAHIINRDQAYRLITAGFIFTNKFAMLVFLIFSLIFTSPTVFLILLTLAIARLIVQGIVQRNDEYAADAYAAYLGLAQPLADFLSWLGSMEPVKQKLTIRSFLYMQDSSYPSIKKRVDRLRNF